MSNQPDEPQDSVHCSICDEPLLVTHDGFNHKTERKPEVKDHLPKVNAHKIARALTTALAANHELGESLVIVTEKYRLMAGERDGLEAEVERLVDDKEQVIADSFGAQEQLSRALVEKRQQADIAEMFSDWWHELMSATNAGLHLSTIKTQHEAALRWIRTAHQLGQQRDAAGEAVKSACIEYLDSRGQLSPASGMNRAVDVDAVIGTQENSDGNS